MKKNKNNFIPTVKCCLLLLIIISAANCNTETNKDKSKTIISDSAVNGRSLAINYCQRCHLFPEPELLDKNTWVNNVLPNMGWRLGIRANGADPYADLIPEEEKILRQMNIYPEEPLLSDSEWKKIMAYYEKNAPAEPLQQKKDSTENNKLTQFEAALIKFDERPLPQTSLLKFNKAASQLYVGDAQKTLYILNNKIQLADSWAIESAPTDIDFPKNKSPRLLTIGIFAPSDQKAGRLASLDTAKILPQGGVFIEALPRPVQFVASDLNMDGKEDVLICEFGNHTGKLAWYDAMIPSKENVLSSLPGARRSEISDLNHDNKPDIVVLMAQAYEQVLIFYNQGNGKFLEKKVLDFPPVYGVSDFELVDFNKDGFEDILLANGDNWDYSPIRKNYHGIRIYLNDGRDNFKETWFYPLYGASKALARDFDNDGDLDIAAIAFYNNEEKPEQGFVYFSNEGNFKLKPHTISQAGFGKWLTMETGDFDVDGDIDIVLGSYFHTVSELTNLISKGNSPIPQLLLLTNKKKKGRK